MNERAKATLNQYIYYILIGIVSFLTLVFMPMIGSEIPLGIAVPDNEAEWAVFILTRLIVSVLNVLIFHNFMRQAKVNIRDDPNFKQANEIINRVPKKKYKPRSPHKFNGQQYGGKAAGLFCSSLLSTVVLAQALLTYDYMSLLIYLFTVTMAIVFGILQMKKCEEYWTSEYLDWAKSYEAEQQRLKEADEEAALAESDGLAFDAAKAPKEPEINEMEVIETHHA